MLSRDRDPGEREKEREKQRERERERENVGTFGVCFYNVVGRLIDKWINDPQLYVLEEAKKRELFICLINTDCELRNFKRNARKGAWKN